MFEWFADLSKGMRYGVAILCLAVSTVIWFVGYFWPWGWAVGGVLLVAGMFVDD